MNKHKFKELIEAPTNYREFPVCDVSATRTYSGAKNVFIRALIARTVRIVLQYPELAQEYLDGLPKLVVNENVPTISE